MVRESNQLLEGRGFDSCWGLGNFYPRIFIVYLLSTFFQLTLYLIFFSQLREIFLVLIREFKRLLLTTLESARLSFKASNVQQRNVS